ncbi:MAG: flippase-like domain-containing protein [Planctomycetes bacterium]|nr:flippase-like domain-containing protein [Planctomycetota bacterium]
MNRAPPGPVAASSRRKLAFRLAASALVLALLVRMVPWQKLRAALASVPPSTFFLVVLGFVACHLFGVFKWRMVIGQAGARLTLRQSVECYCAGLFSNLFLPSIVGGDVLRALLAGRKSGRMEGAVLGGVADRLLDLMALGVLVVAAGAFVGLDRQGTAGTLLVLVVALSAAAGVVALLVLVRRPLKRWPPRWRRRIAQLLIALRRQGRRPKVLFFSLAGGVAMQGSLIALNAVLGRALGLEASAAAWVFAWSLAKLAGLAPASFNGIGVRDGVFAVLFAPLVVATALPFDEVKARALAASFLWQGVLIVGSLFCGAVWLVLRRRSPLATPKINPEMKVRHG